MSFNSAAHCRSCCCRWGAAYTANVGAQVRRKNGMCPVLAPGGILSVLPSVTPAGPARCCTPPLFQRASAPRPRAPGGVWAGANSMAWLLPTTPAPAAGTQPCSSMPARNLQPFASVGVSVVLATAQSRRCLNACPLRFHLPQQPGVCRPCPRPRAQAGPQGCSGQQGHHRYHDHNHHRRCGTVHLYSPHGCIAAEGSSCCECR